MTEFVFRRPLNTDWICTRPAGHFERVTGTRPPARAVRLPHDAMRDADRTPDAPSGGSSGYYPGGAWRYERVLDVPAEWAGRHVGLTFDGVYGNARVFVDDVQVAHRPNGYARFHVEIGSHLVPGTPATIRVDVRTGQDSRWYSGAGLYRGVELVVADGVHLAPDGVVATTPEVDDEYAAVEVVAHVVNDTARLRVVRARFALADAGAPVAAEDAPVTVPARSTMTVRRKLWIPNPRRWSVEDPHRYDLAVRLYDGEETLDETALRVGVRTVQADPYRGLRINGTPLKLRGACIHHDNGVLGAAAHPEAEARKIARLKAAGFNAVRISHNPASQALLEACDAQGMLVMNEAFDAWGAEKSPTDYAGHFDRWWADDLAALVASSVNHPSVIMYSIGNEIPELGRADGRITGRLLAEEVRRLDPTRLVTNGMQMLFLVDLDRQMEEAGGLNQFMGGVMDRTADGGQGFAAGQNVLATTPRADAAVEEACSVLDVTGYNYAEARYAYDAEHRPTRISVGSETFPSRIAHNWNQVEAHPQVLGDFTWVGHDYLGEAGIGGHAYAEQGATFPYGLGYPNLTAACGDLDLLGEPLPIAAYRALVFGLRTEPAIAVERPQHHGWTIPAPNAWQWTDTIASWTWPGAEGLTTMVEVYADADEVELFLDGRSLGRAPVGDQRLLVARFEVAYAPGELVAVALRDGAEVGRTSLATAGEVTALSLSRTDVAPDGTPTVADLDADGGLTFVTAELVDAAGRRNTGSDRLLRVEVSGPGELIGLGSGAPRTEERFDAWQVTSHDGRAMAVVRATGPGEIVVRFADADGLAAEVVVPAV